MERSLVLKHRQKTLERKVSCVGVGLHSGSNVTLSLLPAPVNHGIVFKRVDITGFDNIVPANYNKVTKTQLGTTISNDQGTIVSTVEHLMAALWGCGIDNALIEVDSAEIPIMDGSAEPFVFLAECAGIKEQNVDRKIIKVIKQVEVRDGDKYAIVKPSDDFAIDLEIDFSSKAISNQKWTYSSNAVSFKTDLCRARTFGFDHEVEHLRSLGLARGGSLDNAIVISGDKILNKEGLRYDDEFVRHKLLDCIGDFFLAGKRIQGNFTAYKSGHGLNNKLLHKIFEDRSSYEII
jgi:UDP-3-O-[3-hydroxymyristoyl] N-acetylglucosamine deacetylase